MKSKQNRIYVVLFLAFGFMSCSSDSSDGPTQISNAEPVPSGEKFQVFLKKPNSSLIEIKSTMEEVGVNDHFIDHNGHDDGYNTRTLAKCKADYIDGLYTRETQQTGTLITIRNIIPLEVFEPSLKENPKVECNLEIIYIDKDTQQDRALVKVRVFINDIQQDSNLYLPNVPDNSQPLFIRNEIQGELELPENNLESKTLCINSMKNNFPSNGKLNYQEAFDDSLFFNNNVNTCRFVMSNPTTHTVYVSKKFKVQNIASNLSVVWKNMLTGETTNDYLNKPLSTIEIKNNSPSPTYIAINRTLPQLRVMTVYTRMFAAGVYSFVGWYNKLFPVHWDLSELMHISFDPQSNLDTYMLKPHQELSVKINLQGLLNCFSDFHSQPGEISMNPTFCGGAPFLAGILYNMKLPTMLTSRYTQPTAGSWHPVNVEHFPTENLVMVMPERDLGFDFGNYNIWARNSQVDQTCTGFTNQFSVDKIDRANQWFPLQLKNVCVLE